MAAMGRKWKAPNFFTIATIYYRRKLLICTESQTGPSRSKTDVNNCYRKRLVKKSREFFVEVFRGPNKMKFFRSFPHSTYSIFLKSLKTSNHLYIITAAKHRCIKIIFNSEPSNQFISYFVV